MSVNNSVILSNLLGKTTQKIKNAMKNTDSSIHNELTASLVRLEEEMTSLQAEMVSLREDNANLHHDNKYMVSLMTILRERLSELEKQPVAKKKKTNETKNKAVRDKFGRFVKCEK